MEKMGISRSFIILKNNEIRSIAIGGFDGMHIAHQKLFQKLGSNGALIVIETGYANLTPCKSRENYFDGNIYYYNLQEIKHLSGEEFLAHLCNIFPKLSKIVVGYDFGFGLNKAHSAYDIKNFFGGEVQIVDEIFCDGISVHSREIRKFISNGQIKQANQFLGKPYQIDGFCIKGQGLGKSTFVPTVNIQVKDFLIPSEGIYVTKTKIADTWQNSVTFVGHRISTDKQFAIETHLIDIQVPKPDGQVSIVFFEKLRENKKYDDFTELKKQILEDIKNAMEVLRNLH